MTTNYNEELKEVQTKVETIEPEVHATKTHFADLMKAEKGKDFDVARKLATIEMEKRQLRRLRYFDGYFACSFGC